MDSVLNLNSWQQFKDNLKCISVVKHVTEKLGKKLIVQTGKLSSGNSQIVLKQLFVFVEGFRILK